MNYGNKNDISGFCDFSKFSEIIKILLRDKEFDRWGVLSPSPPPQEFFLSPSLRKKSPLIDPNAEISENKSLLTSWYIFQEHVSNAYN